MSKKIYVVRLTDEAIKDALVARGYKPEQVTPQMILNERRILALDIKSPKKTVFVGYD